MSVFEREISRGQFTRGLLKTAAVIAVAPGSLALTSSPVNADQTSVPETVAQAGSDTTCAPVLGFAAMADLSTQDGMVLKCVTNETDQPNGDATEQFIDIAHNNRLITADYRKEDNWTAETDGYYSWVHGPYGLQKRLNTARFPWEANPDNLPTANPIPLQNPVSAQDAISMLQNYEAAHQAPQPDVKSQIRQIPGAPVYDRNQIPGNFMPAEINQLKQNGVKGTWKATVGAPPGSPVQEVYSNLIVLKSQVLPNNQGIEVTFASDLNITPDNMASADPNQLHIVTFNPTDKDPIGFVSPVNNSNFPGLQPVFENDTSSPNQFSAQWEFLIHNGDMVVMFESLNNIPLSGTANARLAIAIVRPSN